MIIFKLCQTALQIRLIHYSMNFYDSGGTYIHTYLRKNHMMLEEATTTNSNQLLIFQIIVINHHIE